MACTVNILPERVDSEMEEGEIVDELDDLSDISSEEEFLLRQRLRVLENYNNVLERTKRKAKHSSSRSGSKRHNLPVNYLSDISGSEFDDSSQVNPEKSIIVVRDLKHRLDHDYAQVTPKQSITVLRNTKKPVPSKPKSLKLQERQERKETEPPKCNTSNGNKKKVCRKKRTAVKVINPPSESEESEDEYRNKRRKLANAVVVNRGKTDGSSLQARLNKMLYGSHTSESVKTVNQKIAIEKRSEIKDVSCSPIKFDIINLTNEDVSIISSDGKEDINSDEGNNSKVIINTESSDIKDGNVDDEEKENRAKEIESIDLSTDDDIAVEVNGVIAVDSCSPTVNTVDNNSIVKIPENGCEGKKKDEQENSVDDLDLLRQHALKITENARENNKKNEEQNSDDDLEMLRQHALQTKSSKNNNKPIQEKTETQQQKPQSEDEDSDTTELRLICLKSALLKKAIEMKQKQKQKKRLSQSIGQNDFSLEDKELYEDIVSDNNTDIEAMDMDIGSDGDEKTKDTVSKQPDNSEQCGDDAPVEPIMTDGVKSKVTTEDEFDEDEDLLRAKLLTSLSKNLPNLVDPTILQAFEESPVKKTKQNKPTNARNVIKKPEKRIIINVGESDSEGEHEATKNLTKMHMELSTQIDFQQKLDMFLKSARLEVEKEKQPSAVKEPLAPKTPQKFVAKAVDHLPESEQMEYKSLVKRMAELEKIKQARQVTVTTMNQGRTIKGALQPRNVLTNSKAIVNYNDEQISLSRKKIAVESARMMELKQEATKLSQKYKIVATELKNISTAITLNKKEQRSAQIRLAKIRMQHQRLLNSQNYRHSKLNNNHAINQPSTITQPSQNQNENMILKKESKHPETQKSLTICVVNDMNKKQRAVLDNRLSIEINLSSNKKIVKTSPKIDPSSDSHRSLVKDTSLSEKNGDCKELNDRRKDDYESPLQEKNGDCKELKDRRKDDYESPLQALGDGTWEVDPNAILCPFELGGHCKDPDCKYLHPKPSNN